MLLTPRRFRLRFESLDAMRHGQDDGFRLGIDMTGEMGHVAPTSPDVFEVRPENQSSLSPRVEPASSPGFSFGNPETPPASTGNISRITFQLAKPFPPWQRPAGDQESEILSKRLYLNVLNRARASPYRSYRYGIGQPENN